MMRYLHQGFVLVLALLTFLGLSFVVRVVLGRFRSRSSCRLLLPSLFLDGLSSITLRFFVPEALPSCMILWSGGITPDLLA
jgi:hypothetical protein